MNQENLVQLFNQWSAKPALDIKPLPVSGSSRRYFRITSQSQTVIGVINDDEKENRAFILFSKHFLEKGLAVPQIYAQNLSQGIYLQEDLGKTTLFDFISENQQKEGYKTELVLIYKKIVDQLLQFQFKGSEGLDFSLCYPRAAFDAQSMHWDLTYFKYYFLKLAKVSFDEQELENDFKTLIDFLLQSPNQFFLYRDFQSRNIMLKNDKVFFIDYQGGRKGALQYDLASLLFDAKADLTNEFREEILNYYIEQLKKYSSIEPSQFRAFYDGYVLIRILQAFGAYGFRGFFERKEHFLLSIPFAVRNIQWLIQNTQLPIKLPELFLAIQKIIDSPYLKEISQPTKRLTVRVQSFSYKRDIPYDEKGNGGGFVFDCRGLHNPGRYEAYKILTGNDQPVIDFLQNEPSVEAFLKAACAMVDISINTYLERGFADLMINFGCTGGQHRSVYCANYMAKYLKEKYHLNIILRHREQELKTPPKD